MAPASRYSDPVGQHREYGWRYSSDSGRPDREVVDPDEPFELEITDVLDLHTVPPRDVREAVEAYLDEARVRGFRFVRIIHGRGIGVQRETVRAVLARTPFVQQFSDAPSEAGGWGATIATLSLEPEQ